MINLDLKAIINTSLILPQNQKTGKYLPSKSQIYPKYFPGGEELEKYFGEVFISVKSLYYIYLKKYLSYYINSYL